MSESPPYNIMVIDDDHRAAEYLADLLRLGGHSVVVVHSPRNAMQVLSEVVPDVLFVDVNLPGIDGFEVCRFLRRDPLTEAVPIVIVSAHGEQSYRDMAIVAGANLYLVKPAMLEDLEQALRTVFPKDSGNKKARPDPKR